jgi:hypothetical protein
MASRNGVDKASLLSDATGLVFDKINILGTDGAVGKECNSGKQEAAGNGRLFVFTDAESVLSRK